MVKYLTGLFLFIFVCNAYGAPSTTISIPNSFTANTVIQSANVNSDFNEVSTKYNSHSHTDITQLGTITVGTWQGSVVGTQYGGTGKDWSGIASGAIPYFNGTGALTTLSKPASGSILFFNSSTLQWDALPQGASQQILTSNGATFNPSWATAKIVNITHFETGTYATGTGTVTIDNNTPLNTEGDQYMSLVVTPTSSNNILKVDVCIQWGHAQTGQDGYALLFQDSVPGALAVAGSESCATATMPSAPLVMTHYMNSGVTGSTTLKVRCGATGGAGFFFNGASGGASFNGRNASSITVTEIGA